MAMKKCKECGADISSSAKKCPKCGKRLSYTGLCVLLGIILFIIILIYAISLPFSSSLTSSSDSFSLLEVTNSYYDGYGAYYIEGSIKNNTNQTYRYVEVTFLLYDADGNQLGTATTNVTDIEPNAIWKFKAMDNTSYPEKVASYKLLEISNL